MPPIRLLTAGAGGVLAELGGLDDAVVLHAGLISGHRPAGVVDIVPAARTVLVTFDPAVLAREDVHAWIRAARDGTAPMGTTPETVEVPVRYDGADLAEVADRCGLTPDQVVAAHSAPLYTVAFCGFSPGFAYLTGVPAELRMPRRSSPRTTVPAGSVALADEFTGVYPRASPGGWQLIGTTDLATFDPQRTPPALLVPGTPVRFVPVGMDPPPAAGPGAPGRTQGEGPGKRERSGAMTITVLAPGPLTTVQDLGRPGLAHLGVSRSGAADRPSLVRANRFVGNPDDAACLEVTLGRLRLDVQDDAVVALTGASCAVTIGGTPGAMDGTLRVHAGNELRLGAPPTGLRTYLAVRGGLDVPTVLGSRSTDVLSGLGPKPLAAGTVLHVGAPIGTTEDPEMEPTGSSSTAPDLAAPIDVLLGPRDDWFTADAVAALLSATWTVAADADRVGVRLDGPVLQRRVTAELPSEPMVAGALQVPPAGRPIVFLADHPVTGGYPVIGVVPEAGLARIAQARPGRTLHFRAVGG